MKIPIARTCLSEDEISSVLAPLRSGWLVQGPYVRDFEERWSAFTGAEYSVAVTSCTSALHLSLVALGVGKGDEVIVPSFTWIATANVVEHVGASVVFCDIDLRTFNLDSTQLESLVTSRTKAVIPVHLFGLAADMAPILAVAKKHRLHVVEDAACGFGARYEGHHVGTFGDTGCFSFHPRKAITTGEGGMVSTSSKDIADRIRRLRDHGAMMTDLQRHLGPKPYLLADHPEAGYNQRMTDFQAALGCAQMLRATDIVDERRRIAARYDAAFADLQWLHTPAVMSGSAHGYQSYACLLAPERLTLDSVAQVNAMRNAWMDRLHRAGVSTRPATHAVHMLTYYRTKYHLDATAFPNAYAADQCSISLPLFNGMSLEEQDYVIDQVRRGFA